ncbi:MAG: type I methionyl aminopeptidase [Lentisphaerae bacterium]|nr:type I methionyl aminopeptidase [Lentisphaerota bacterium]
MIVIKNEKDLKSMRASGAMAAEVLDAVSREVAPGVTTGELSDHAAELIASMGGKSAFLGYREYPGNICVSVNECVVHGIPGSRRVELGDIVSIDVGVVYEGYVGDTARTVMVGVSDPGVLELVRTAEAALDAGIGVARAGNRLSDISHAIEKTAIAAGFSVVRDFVGHGIGRSMHEDPQVPNFGQPGRGPRLKDGMTLALEPMINMGTGEVRVEDDGWTVRTADGAMSAHVEHTIAVTADMPEILTTVKKK